jgi:hypothetical protein
MCGRGLKALPIIFCDQNAFLERYQRLLCGLPLYKRLIVFLFFVARVREAQGKITIVCEQE